MPPKRNPIITNQSITDLSVDNLRRLVREEVQSTMRDELNDLTNHLGKIESDVKLLCEFKAKVDPSKTLIRVSDWVTCTIIRSPWSKSICKM